MSTKAISYVFTWHSLSDACPKCQMLDGHEWRDQDLFGDVLWDPLFGNLWDLNNDIPLTHSNCRCQLEVKVEFDWGQYQPFQDFWKALEEFGFYAQ